MENIKFAFFSIIILAILLFVGYWGFKNIESGSTHIVNQELKELKEDNIRLNEEISLLKTKIDILESNRVIDTPVIIENNSEVEIQEPTEPVVLKYQSLIDEFQKLIDGNIYMKKGSKGPQVGTIQKFINLYNNTSIRVDNDYGPKLENEVKKFQTTEKLISDGEVGPNTYNRMIDWLKKQ